MLFWGTILSSTLRAGPSTSEVKRHKVLSTSKSLALFCSGLVILLANEASKAISEYRVPVARRCTAAETTCAAAAASSQAAAAGAGDAHAASHIRSATFGKQLQYLLQKQQPTNIHEQSLHSSVQLSLLFSSPTMTTYTNATSVCPRLYATRTYRRWHCDCHIHIRTYVCTYIVATRQVSKERRGVAMLLLLLDVPPPPPPPPRSVPWTRLLLVLYTLLNFQVLSKTSFAEASDL